RLDDCGVLLRLLRLLLGGEGGGDLYAVETAVLNEDFVGAGAGHDDSGEIDTGYVAFERFLVADGEAVDAGTGDAETFEKSEVGMIAGESEDEVVVQRERAFSGFELDGVGRDFED